MPYKPGKSFNVIGFDADYSSMTHLSRFDFFLQVTLPRALRFSRPAALSATLSTQRVEMVSALICMASLVARCARSFRLRRFKTWVFKSPANAVQRRRLRLVKSRASNTLLLTSTRVLHGKIAPSSPCATLMSIGPTGARTLCSSTSVRLVQLFNRIYRLSYRYMPSENPKKVH